MILYYCRKSPFSIRTPYKIAQNFFLKGPRSNINMFRIGAVDTHTHELEARNPSSYFVYSRYRRLHEFFSSSDLYDLERRYPLMVMMDITRCFPSIYSHSITWAVVSTKFAKDNTSSMGFANRFDRFMQSMNYNETNGICVGPELSRIFAEIILTKIDVVLESSATGKNLRRGLDYEIRRYVDDYFLFVRDTKVARSLSRLLAEALGSVGLSLNEQKLQTLGRPFLTPTSRAISLVGTVFSKFSDRILEKRQPGDARTSVYVPRYIRDAGRLRNSFLLELKTACSEVGSGYEVVANYLVAALTLRIEWATDWIEEGIEEGIDPKRYVDLILLLSDLAFFLYTVKPSVSSSYSLSRLILRIEVLVESNLSEYRGYIVDYLSNLVIILHNSDSLKNLIEYDAKIPIESLNILVAFSSITKRDIFYRSTIQSYVAENSNFEYFQTVSILYCIGSDIRFDDLRYNLVDHLLNRAVIDLDPETSAHDAHLLLDMLSCPYVNLSDRQELLDKIRTRLSLPKLSAAELGASVKEMEENPWFVQWSGPGLFNLLQKKELNSVY